ncbi:MAG: MGMT family protein [Acidobacteriota bacterium]|nr:MGMT family protein [Acidobacteriota bacterium]
MTGGRTGTGPSAYDRIYEVVGRIPRGRVATYGQVARLAGLGGHARQVGYALHATPDALEIPWHRVINAKGEVSARSDRQDESIQEQLLRAEGIRFTASGRIDLERYRWQPR